MMMKAFMTRILRGPGLTSVQVPKPEPGELQIKVAYVSLNPTDYFHAAISLPPSKIVGCDFSGTVTALGKGVNRSKFSKGDRIAGVVHGCKDSRSGAFAQTIVADAGMCWKVPNNVSLEAASTSGVGWMSATQALAQRLYRDEKETSEDDTLLIYSAATGTGMHAIQQARLDHPSTFIIAIAASQHHAYLRELGADATFDYHSSSLVRDVQALGRDIRKAFDCYSQGPSTALTAQCMMPGKKTLAERSGGKKAQRRVIRTLPPRLMSGPIPAGVRTDEWIVAYTSGGKPFWLLFKYYPAVPEDHKLAKTYFKHLEGLLENGKFKPVRHRLMPGGLKNIGQGFEEMRQGRNRGEKLVYAVAGEATNGAAVMNGKTEL